jgi:hypothetical protein
MWRICNAVSWRCYLRWFPVFLAILILVGCSASGPAFKPELNRPDSSRALLYIYRPDTIIGIGNADVPFLHLDGRRLTRIRIGGHIALPVSPGQHKLATTESLLGNDTGKVRGEATVTVPAGAILYLRYSETFKSIVPIVFPGGVAVITSGQFAFEPVPESEALGELAKTRRLEMSDSTR